MLCGLVFPLFVFLILNTFLRLGATVWLRFCSISVIKRFIFEVPYDVQTPVLRNLVCGFGVQSPASVAVVSAGLFRTQWGFLTASLMVIILFFPHVWRCNWMDSRPTYVFTWAWYWTCNQVSVIRYPIPTQIRCVHLSRDWKAVTVYRSVAYFILLYFKGDGDVRFEILLSEKFLGMKSFITLFLKGKVMEEGR